ncbi:MAG: (2Fe-2S)-binding protein [Gammaproteobacteria bacterium]|nr:(2Fe-2S)-binding protein [Gammaproteobacteria bacterium]
MYVCLCKGITDTQIKAAITENGFTKLSQLNKELGICGQCGKCAKETKRIMKECQNSHEILLPWPEMILKPAYAGI